MDDRIIITYCLIDDFCKFCEESQKKFESFTLLTYKDLVRFKKSNILRKRWN